MKQSFDALAPHELEAVGGGWCGNDIRWFPFPKGEPIPYPSFDRSFSSKLDLVALNPQPLPPQEIGGFDAGFTLG